ncbi:MAG: thioredoxin family protein [Candidatus Cloacimonetes bacterium]|nr:thioredoxin family protein [Candidatus Cloacimonadota bacterium]
MSSFNAIHLTIGVFVFCCSAFANPSLLIFVSDHCSFSKELVRVLSTSSNLKSTLNGFQYVFIDHNKQPEIKADFRVFSVPTLIFLESDGKETWRESGYSDETDLLLVLKSRLGKSDGLEEAVRIAKASKLGKDRYIAAVQMLGRGQDGRLIEFLADTAPEHPVSPLEEASLNSLIYRSEILSENFSRLQNDLEFSCLGGHEKWLRKGQIAVDELSTVASHTGKWTQVMEILSPFATYCERPELLRTLSSAYLRASKDLLTGFHLARKAEKLAREQKLQSPNYLYQLRQWALHFGLKTRQAALEQQIYTDYGIRLL